MAANKSCGPLLSCVFEAGLVKFSCCSAIHMCNSFVQTWCVYVSLLFVIRVALFSLLDIQLFLVGAKSAFLKTTITVIFHNLFFPVYQVLQNYSQIINKDSLAVDAGSQHGKTISV